MYKERRGHGTSTFTGLLQQLTNKRNILCLTAVPVLSSEETGQNIISVRMSISEERKL